MAAKSSKSRGTTPEPSHPLDTDEPMEDDKVLCILPQEEKTTPERKEETSIPRSVSYKTYSPHRRIVKAYKRRAVQNMVNSPIKRIIRAPALSPEVAVIAQSSPVSSTEKPKEEFPEVFTRGLVTVRRIETLLEPKLVEQNLKDQNISVESKRFETIPTPKVVTKPGLMSPPEVPTRNPMTAATSRPFIPKVLRTPLRKFNWKTPMQNPKPPTLQLSPPPKVVSATSSGSRVRLQKLSNGLYGVVKTGNVQKEPETLISKLEVKSVESSKEQSNKLPVKETITKAVPLNFKPSQNSSSVGTSSLVNTNSQSAPVKSAVAQSSSSNLRLIVRIPEKEKIPEAFKYLIPQNMLASSTDKAKSIDEKASNSTPEAITNAPKDDKAPEVESEDDDDKTESSLRRRPRRKTALVPKTDDSELEVELENFILPPRPKANIDLINKLAMYRVMVENLQKKVDVPKIDFNENSDDYIDKIDTLIRFIETEIIPEFVEFCATK